MTTGGSRKDRPIMGYAEAKDALDLNAENDRLRRENAELREALLEAEAALSAMMRVEVGPKLAETFYHVLAAPRRQARALLGRPTS